jgi:hypothetical protein
LRLSRRPKALSGATTGALAKALLALSERFTQQLLGETELVVLKSLPLCHGRNGPIEPLLYEPSETNLVWRALIGHCLIMYPLWERINLFENFEEFTCQTDHFHPNLRLARELPLATSGAHVIRASKQIIWNRENLMNNRLKRPPQKATYTSSEKVYLKFEPTPIMLAKIKALARQVHCTPFEMCVELLREALAARRSRVRS